MKSPIVNLLYKKEMFLSIKSKISVDCFVCNSPTDKIRVDNYQFFFDSKLRKTK